MLVELRRDVIKDAGIAVNCGLIRFGSQLAPQALAPSSNDLCTHGSILPVFLSLMHILKGFNTAIVERTALKDLDVV